MTDLTFVPTDEMLEELKRRFDYMIFAGVTELGAATGRHEHKEAFHGHVTFCAGMATDLIRTMQDWARCEDDDDDPDAPGGGLPHDGRAE